MGTRNQRRGGAAGAFGERSGRLDGRSALTLVAVVLVVGLVSLPKLRDFALQENEADAMRLIRRLEATAIRLPSTSRPGTIEELVGAMLPPERSLQDAEFLEHGTLLRRRGYLFDWTPGIEEGGGVLRAWPWEWQRTGLGTFYIEAGALALAHPNDGGLWSGPDGAPDPLGRASSPTQAAPGEVGEAGEGGEGAEALEAGSLGTGGVTDAVYRPPGDGDVETLHPTVLAQGWRSFPRPE